MESTWKTKPLVASIDFGTTHSGFALSFLTDYEKDKTNSIAYMWKSGNHPRTTKTPTCILLKPDHTFHSFGYEAEKKYASLVEADTHKQWHYFRRFKMKLFDNYTEHRLYLGSYIKDAEGRDFSALTVFAHSIRYLKDKIEEIIKEACPCFREDDIYYVLTTPAIWSERSKQFMRKAAEKAKIPSEHLKIAVDAQCAIMYSKALQKEPSVFSVSTCTSSLLSGSSYIVINLEEETFEIMVYRVSENDTFEEIIAPDIGKWEGDTINLKFEGYLRSIFGEEVFTEFKNECTEEYLDMLHRVKHSKNEFKDDQPMIFRTPLPIHKLRLESSTVRELFRDTVTNISAKIEGILDKTPEQIDTLVCVGDVFGSGLIKHAIQERFRGKTVITADSAVMAGAIIYSRDTGITETDDIDWNEAFDSKLPPSNMRKETDDGFMCKNMDPVSFTNVTLATLDFTWKDKLFVASIDFGTTHSGFALSFLSDYEKNKTSIITHMWKSGDHPSTTKTPTCILLKPDQTFHSFGYEAEKKYASLVEADTHKQWHYFRRFKMKLFDNSTEHRLCLGSYIKDAEGRDFSALTVFAHSIRYLKDKIEEIVTEVLPGFREDDIYYVLTTPAIWSERSKQFMRKAAEKAMIPSDHLKIALEPECAAVYIKTKELPLLAGSSGGNKTLTPGSCYMVIDLGGGTLDITAYRVNQNDSFEEIITPDGGPWGGDSINLKFEGFLLSLVGGEAITNFKEQDRENYLDLQREFEHKKCVFEDHEDEVTAIRIPESLRQFHKEINQEELAESIRQTRYADKIKLEKGRMKIKNSTFREFFDDTLDNIFSTIEGILGKIPDKIDTLICVGGFSDCKLIKRKLRERFHDKMVIIPNEAVSSIMKGAIIYGRDTSIIETRLCRYTFGLDWNEEFDPKNHPLSKREETDDGYMCKDIFLKLISKNDPVSIGKPAKEIEAYTKWKNQTEIDFPFYRSESIASPKFIDEPGCHHMGTMTIDLPDSNLGIDHSVTLKVYFGDTELRAEAVDKGRKCNVTFNLFETEI